MSSSPISSVAIAFEVELLNKLFQHDTKAGVRSHHIVALLKEQGLAAGSWSRWRRTTQWLELGLVFRRGHAYFLSSSYTSSPNNNQLQPQP